MGEPTKTDWTKYSWLATPTAIVVAAALLLVGPRYLPSVDPTPGPPLPPAPVVVVPVRPTLEDSTARRNDIRDDSLKASLVDVIKHGNGTYTLTYEPDKKSPITWTVVISGGNEPNPPKPVPPGPTPPIPPEPPVVDPTTKPTAATYVYEKDQNGVPSAVMSGLNRLNRENKIIATVFEEDSTNGKTGVPAQYKVAYDAAKKEGLPVLVITAGDKVLKTIKAPKTEPEIMEAVK
jgi:hypothetical protein